MTILSHNDLLTLARLEAENSALRERLGRAAHHARRVKDQMTFWDGSTEQVRSVYGAAEDALRALGEEKCVEVSSKQGWLPYVGFVFVSMLLVGGLALMIRNDWFAGSLALVAGAFLCAALSGEGPARQMRPYLAACAVVGGLLGFNAKIGPPFFDLPFWSGVVCLGLGLGLGWWMRGVKR